MPQTKRGTLLTVVRRILLSVLALVTATLITGTAYEGIGRMRDSARYPARGEMVDVGGYRLNLVCTGKGVAGSPTIVLDSGLGEAALSWQMVQQGVAGFAHVCSYDRAGYGRSEPGPNPRSSLQIAKELHSLLRNSQTWGPYALVGHSFGGYNIRVFAGLFRSEVSGMVLVDSSHEDQQRFMPASAKAEAKNLQTMAPFIPAIRCIGALRIRDALQPNHMVGSQLPPEATQELSALTLRPNFVPAVLHEYGLLSTESSSQVRAAGNLEEIPLVALTAGQPTDPQDREFDSFRSAWINELQPSVARLSTRGRSVVQLTCNRFRISDQSGTKT